MIFFRFTLTILMLTTMCNVIYAESKMGPIIENYGPIYPVSNMDIKLPEDFHYRVVFDVTTTSSTIDAHSRRLESVARFLNMHADRGVPIEKMNLIVVMHGKATKDILTDKKYHEMHGTNNPNRELIEALAAAGVRFYVCGQTSDYFNFQRKDILPEIGIALSAMTQLVVYQSRGYALLP